jgi:hypothetical protein
MGIARDLAANPKLIEMVSSLGEDFLRRKREEKFNQMTSEYENNIKGLPINKGEGIDFDALEKRRLAGANFAAKAGELGNEIQSRAINLQTKLDDAFNQSLNQNIAVGQYNQRLNDLTMKRKQNVALDAIAASPEYAEYERFKRSLTPEQLQGAEGNKLAQLQAKILQDYDPEKVAGFEASKLFATVPTRPQREYDAAYGAARDRKLLISQDLETVLGQFGIPITRPESLAIVNSSTSGVNEFLKRPDVQKRMSTMTPEQQADFNYKIRTVFNPTYLKDVGSTTRTEMTTQSREEVARDKAKAKVDADRLNEQADIVAKFEVGDKKSSNFKSKTQIDGLLSAYDVVTPMVKDLNRSDAEDLLSLRAGKLGNLYNKAIENKADEEGILKIQKELSDVQGALGFVRSKKGSLPSSSATKNPYR